jgi:membrane protease YdiL (CAAX protease family)
MDIKDLFIANGRLRAAWRTAISFVLWVAIFLIIRLFVNPQPLIRYVVLFAVIFALSSIFVRYIDRRPVATIGFMFHSRWVKEYLQGVLLGASAISIVFLFNLSLGYYTVVQHNITPSLLIYIFTYAMVLSICASGFEELAFRGYMFQNFIEATNVFIATVVLSAFFGIGHLWNAHASWVSVLNTVAAGVLFALAYIKTKSLWLPCGIHFSWNFFMGRIYSLPGSGAKAAQTLLDVKQQGPIVLTGGDYGPEAGIPALIVFIIACFIVYYWPKISTSSEMAKLWENYKQRK